MTITAYANINDWTAIHNMTFNGSSSQTSAERVYIPAGESITAIYDKEIMSFKVPNRHTWSDKAVKAAKLSQAFIDAIVDRTLKWCDKRDKAILEEQPLPKWKRANIAFEYKGRTLPHKERKPILPLTPEQEAARIARNRAKLGLV